MKGYTKSYEQINGINIYRHSLREGNSLPSYFFEYSTALFWEFILSLKIYFKKRFQVIHGCNPPDLIFLVALFFKLFGVKYVFDHHDINPELYLAKFNKKGFFYRFLIFTEKLTFKTANYSIATNESYKEIAIRRGGMPENNVEVIRSGPKLDRLQITRGNPKYKKGKDFLIGYVGVIGEQEGLDLLLESVNYLISQKASIQVAVVGGGVGLQSIISLSKEMGLQDHVDFYGRVSDDLLIDILNSADVCVNPDKPTSMNNLSTMNKIMEYMALKKPIVQYDLKEGKVSAREASLYARNTSPEDFGNKILWLLQNPEKRRVMGEYGYYRVKNELSWEIESKKLILFYNRILNTEEGNKKPS